MSTPAPNEYDNLRPEAAAEHAKREATGTAPVGEFNHDVEIIIADTKKMLLETTYRHGAPDSAVMLSLATQVLLARVQSAHLAEAERCKEEREADWQKIYAQQASRAVAAEQNAEEIRGEIIEQANGYAATIADLNEQLSAAEKALQSILTDVPACDEHGQLYHMHFDENGTELGPEFIDPLAVIQHLQGVAHRALSARNPETKGSQT